MKCLKHKSIWDSDGVEEEPAAQSHCSRSNFWGLQYIVIRFKSFWSRCWMPVFPVSVDHQSILHSSLSVPQNISLFSQILDKWYLFNYLSNYKTARRTRFLTSCKKYLNLFRQRGRLNPSPKLLLSCCSIKKASTSSSFYFILG